MTAVLPPYHRNVTIEGNDFRVAGPVLLEANRVAGLRFAGNTVTAADWRAQRPQAASFVLAASEDVTLAHNRINLPAPVTIKQATPAARLVIEENTGMAGN